MCRRAVAFVLFKPVIRIDFCIFVHHTVTVNLGDNTRRADRIGKRVAVHHALLRERNINRHIPVRKYGVWRNRQTFDSLFHSKLGRLQNVDFVNGLFIHHIPVRIPASVLADLLHHALQGTESHAVSPESVEASDSVDAVDSVDVAGAFDSSEAVLVSPSPPQEAKLRTHIMSAKNNANVLFISFFPFLY